MPINQTPHTPSEARLAHLAADLVLQHGLAQRFSFQTVQTLLAVARRSPAVEPEDARKLVAAALSAIVTAEVIALRDARP